jgi:hypothetical protein
MARAVKRTSAIQLRSLAAWLVEQEAEEAVMESTAQYWKPVWEALERYWKPVRQEREGRLADSSCGILRSSSDSATAALRAGAVGDVDRAAVTGATVSRFASWDLTASLRGTDARSGRGTEIGAAGGDTV